MNNADIIVFLYFVMFRLMSHVQKLYLFCETFLPATHKTGQVVKFWRLQVGRYRDVTILAPYIPESVLERENILAVDLTDDIEGGRLLCLCLIRMNQDESTNFWASLMEYQRTVYDSFTDWKERE